ncbi:hypothetical protein [Pandoraea bronchicola]|uniref:Uncharacterized protein n=1 Tax=Pandoraea bronchicola TaxID=2508287 RepID=A0A5E5BXX8_9BURK|nr:hypothetical protein [Pandoraea bronchicola]VVE89875.1 hypothetical protein PBR20603_03848 [Pandoraea bronchicola]
MSVDIPKFAADELDTSRLNQLISTRASFQVVGVADIGKVVEMIEGRIEKSDLKCRVYTEYRSASLATIFSPAAILGVGAAIGIAAHNLATYDPDYEIGKNKVAGTVTVKYMK